MAPATRAVGCIELTVMAPTAPPSAAALASVFEMAFMSSVPRVPTVVCTLITPGVLLAESLSLPAKASTTLVT